MDSLLVFGALLISAALWAFWQWAQKKPSFKSRSLFARDYISGLNYLLNEQEDKAVALFIKLLEVDGDTVETHLALGSLFRKRGEVDRAIRIHQNLIARPQLSTNQRAEALLSLGRDYLTAGVLDRAERVFKELISVNIEQKHHALFHLQDIYQQEKAWSSAIEVVHQLQAVTAQPMLDVIAHYYCEIADQALKERDLHQAKRYIKMALQNDAHSIRAQILQAKLYMLSDAYKQAIRVLKVLLSVDSIYIMEVMPMLLECYRLLGDEVYAVREITQLIQQSPAYVMIWILANSESQNLLVTLEVKDYWIEQLKAHASLSGLLALIRLLPVEHETALTEHLGHIQEVAQQLLQSQAFYRCQQCGFSGKNMHWLCPGCKCWNTIKPVVA